ncbi:hypothetical protein BJ742DRAFT_765924 [Cladochytrium replicatum]|nr:hypothetical protein BJ742DRAFT_765924 [Cladochytrium replicatum]
MGRIHVADVLDADERAPLTMQKAMWYSQHTEAGQLSSSKVISTVLHACSDSLNVVSTSKSLISRILQDSAGVDNRIARLREESTLELEGLQRENTEMEQQLASIQKELAGIQRIAYAKDMEIRKSSKVVNQQQLYAGGSCRAARGRNAEEGGQELNTVTMSSGSSPMPPDPNGLAMDTLWNKPGAGLANTLNPDLLGEENLLKIVEDWKRENASLSDMLREHGAAGPFMKQDNVVETLEGELAALGLKLNQLDSALEDEKLKNRKALELKRSLEEELDSSRKEIAKWKAKARAACAKIAQLKMIPGGQFLGHA